MASVNDRAYIYVNQKFVGLIERQDCSVSVLVEAKEGDILDILVENMGRINYGGQMTDRKGILSDVYLDDEVLEGWTMYRLAMKDLSVLKWKEVLLSIAVISLLKRRLTPSSTLRDGTRVMSTSTTST